MDNDIEKIFCDHLYSTRGDHTKRKKYLSWNDYFMKIAVLCSERSKDPVTQVGACVVAEDNRILGIGFNGMPNGCSDDVFPWHKNKEKDVLDNKHLYVCHAELNAIFLYNPTSLKGCTIYVTLFPCNECAKKIIQSGIKKVVYLSDKDDGKDSNLASKDMLNRAKVEFTKHVYDHENEEHA